MSELPWLLVYGHLVWPALLVVAGALGCAMAWVEARRRGRESTAWGRRELARPTSAPDLADGARAVISGVLVVEGDAPEAFEVNRGSAATTARAERRPDSLKDALDRSSSLRAPSVALRGDDGVLIHLEGPIAVLAGSREVWTGCTLPRLPRAVRARVEGADEAGGAMLSNQHVVLASVAAGDRVQAFGRMVARQDIRSVAVRWSLVPAPEPTAQAGEAPLAAVPVVFEGAAVVAGPLRRAVARSGVVASLAAFAGLVLVGELARMSMGGGVAGSATVTARDDQPLAFRSVSADLIAAATPLRREMGVLRVANQARGRLKDAREVRAVSGLWSLTKHCRVGVEILARHGRFAEAIAMGERCGDVASRWTAAQVAMLSGDATRASRLLHGITETPDGFRGQEVFAALAHLYAGRFEESARFLDLAHVRSRREVFGTPLEFALKCAALAVHARAGSAAARTELRAQIQGNQGWRCALFLADLEQGDARLATLRDARVRLGAPYAGWVEVEALLRLEAGDRDVPTVAVPQAMSSPLLHRAAELFRVAGLTRSAHEALAAEPDARLSPAMRVVRARVAASLAAYESVLGRHDEARRLAAALAPDLGDGFTQHEAQELAGAIELRAGDVARATALLRGAHSYDSEPGALAAFLTRDVPDALPWTTRFAADESLESWAGLGAGDGVALTATLAATPGRDHFVDASLAFGLRRLATGAAPARAWLAWGERSPCWRCQERYAAADLSNLAMAARALNLRDEAAEAERQLAAMRATLMRRDVSVAAMLIESM